MLYFSRYKILLTLSIIIISTLIAICSNYYSLGYIKGIKLGLDLKGGSYLLLEPDKTTLKNDYNTQLIKDINSVLRNKNIDYANFNQNSSKFAFNLNNVNDFASFKKGLQKLNSAANINLNNNLVTVTINGAEYSLKTREILEQSIEVLRRRIDKFGTTEPSIKISGDGIAVELPGVENPDEVKEIVGKTARVTFNLLDDAASFQGASLPNGYKYVTDDNDQRYAVSVVEYLGGKNLKTAKLAFNQQNQPAVEFNLDDEGSKAFGKLTSENMGKIMAILLDDKIISTPRINQPILGGNGIIEGSFTLSGAQDLALLLQAGSLPVPLKITEERTVGPTLGQDSIKSGFYSLVLGGGLVFLFMAIFYRKLGILADISLITNTILMFACLSLVGGTLTLPGIAGIILTTGMAVDSNILVYERYNYEIKYAPPHIAMTNSFNRVYQTLLDSNLTTLFVAFFLFYFGTGPVKGFAVTLIVGIITSMFSIFFTTRMLVNWFYLPKSKLQKRI